MLNEVWHQRLRKGGRILLYVLVVVYLLIILDDLSSIKSIESDVSSIQSDVSSLQSEERDLHPKPRGTCDGLRTDHFETDVEIVKRMALPEAQTQFARCAGTTLRQQHPS